MAQLTRENIQSTCTFEKVEVDVTEWGRIINPETGERERTTVFVREMSARERSKWVLAGHDSKNRKIRFEDGQNIDAVMTIQARLAVATCCDADGNLIFTPADVELLQDKPAKVLERIFKAALKLNHISETGIEDEEETVKN